MKTTCPMSLCLGTLLPKVGETSLVVMHFRFYLHVRVNIFDNGSTNNDICYHAF